MEEHLIFNPVAAGSNPARPIHRITRYRIRSATKVADAPPARPGSIVDSRLKIADWAARDRGIAKVSPVTLSPSLSLDPPISNLES
jgi:hypothetical protein